MKPTKRRNVRRPEAIAADIQENCRRFNANETTETEWRDTQARLWREADFGEMLFCGVRSQAARRVEAVGRILGI